MRLSFPMKSFSIAIGTDSGSISSYNVGGRELLTAPLEPNYWRAPTDNDRGNAHAATPGHLAARRHPSANHQREGRTGLPQRRQGDGHCKVARRRRNAKLRLHHLRRWLRRGGERRSSPETLHCPICRASECRCASSSALRNVEWYGRGPQENYWDRNLGAAVGIYKDKSRQPLVPLCRTAGDGKPHRHSLGFVH